MPKITYILERQSVSHALVIPKANANSVYLGALLGLRGWTIPSQIRRAEESLLRIGAGVVAAFEIEALAALKISAGYLTSARSTADPEPAANVVLSQLRRNPFSLNIADRIDSVTSVLACGEKLVERAGLNGSFEMIEGYKPPEEHKGRIVFYRFPLRECNPFFVPGTIEPEHIRLLRGKGVTGVVVDHRYTYIIDKEAVLSELGKDMFLYGAELDRHLLRF